MLACFDRIPRRGLKPLAHAALLGALAVGEEDFPGSALGRKLSSASAQRSSELLSKGQDGDQQSPSTAKGSPVNRGLKDGDLNAPKNATEPKPVLPTSVAFPGSPTTASRDPPRSSTTFSGNPLGSPTTLLGSPPRSPATSVGDPSGSPTTFLGDPSGPSFHPLRHVHASHLESGAPGLFSPRGHVTTTGRRVITIAYLHALLERDARRWEGLVTSTEAPVTSARPGRRLEAANGTVDLALNGSIETNGLYTTTIGIGTPPQNVSVQIDTGSDLLWTQCAPCDNCTISPQLPPVDPNRSSTFASLPCDSRCTALNATAQGSLGCANVSGNGSGNAQPDCGYIIMYGDMSASAGVIVGDMLTLPNATGNVSIEASAIFGCDLAETPNLIIPGMNGLMGLGRGPLSIPSQLYVQNATAVDAFSVCLAGVEGGGGLIFGNTTPPVPLNYTDLIAPKKIFYSVSLDDILVNETRLDLPLLRLINTFLDTGSTAISLPYNVQQAFRDEMLAQVSLPLLNRVFSENLVGSGATCFQLPPSALSDGVLNASAFFPTVRFDLTGAPLLLQPDDYVIFAESQDGSILIGCPLMLSQGARQSSLNSVIIIGDAGMRNHYFVFDRQADRVGLAPINCTTLAPRNASAPVSQAFIPGLSQPSTATPLD
ncbi:aspartyl protease family protein [Klebsormidium nitens]|uniref:Aspartyl protease family protein n=1 Tax=Klebsormidium nitens TaxID=105231 RepID=A0A1Y1HPG3_KLENI|nr:aspartyl protease family protein [Klebsormidium nitens]|eukprot:GAQ79953.1 aspartyl protease family protein [Klebsormidium nitens]